jgi:hypothetical protein
MAGSSNQSTFVTVVGWLVLIFSGMSTLTGLMQSVMLVMVDVFPTVSAEEAGEMPTFVAFVFNNFRAFVLGTTAVYAVIFAAGVGVLRRKEWARRALIAICVLGAVGMAAMAIVMQVMMNDMFRGATDVPPDAAGMMAAMRIFSIVFTIAFVGAFGWLAYKFSTPAIRADFT